MCKKVYLVDTENVPSKWIPLFDNLGVDDKIILFYTSNSSRYPLEIVDLCVKNREKLVFVKCFNGHANALDFQLAAVNGYLFKEDPTAEYVVVSEDGGYDGMIEFMRGMGEKIYRRKSGEPQDEIPQTAHPVPATMKPNKRAPLIEQVALALNMSSTNPIVADVTQTIEAVKVDNTLLISKVAELHNRLQRKYHKTGSKYYTLLRKAGVLKKL